MSYFPVGRDLTASSDISLVVEEERLPVHSQVILVHSKVLGNMITDLVPKGESHMLVPLSDKKAEVELMLKFFYHTAQRVTEFEEAATLVRLSDKYDVPFLLELCEDLLCAEVPNMHLLGYHYGSKGESSSKPMSPIIHELWDLALWLSYAERLGMQRLLPKCQNALMEWFEGFECNGFKGRGESEPAPTELDVLVELVEKHEVSARTLGTILLACYRRQSVERLQILESLSTSNQSRKR